jgi:hypothetical protein
MIAYDYGIIYIYTDNYLEITVLIGVIEKLIKVRLGIYIPF